MDDVRPQGSVKIRRATVSRLPVLASPIPEDQVASPATANVYPPSDPRPTSPGRALGRRRAGTLTQRFFDGEFDDQQADVRPRSPSASSAHAVAPITVAVPGRTSLDEPRGVGGRRRGSSLTKPTQDEIHHAQDEVDLLEVMDQAVSTTATLTNIQSAFIPNWLTRAPVLELEAPTPAEEPSPVTRTSSFGTSDEEEVDPLDVHLAKLLRREKRKNKTREVMRGISAFIKTPVGIFFLFYGIAVVISGASLVLMLMIPSNGSWTSYRKKLWIEIFSQILTGLFTITSLLPLPWRLFDWFNISVIWRYARVTRRRRARRNLPPLRDPNDLPDPADAEFWVGAGGEKMVGPKPKSTPIPPKVKKGKGTETPTGTPPGGDVELAIMESKAGDSATDDEEVVLTEKEENRLRKAQIKFSKSQTWYRPHTTPTHHASPIKWAVWFTLLMIGNSVFQAFLCGVMWGLNRWDRPAWTTGCLIPLSFGCGIGAAVIVWQAGEKTKRKTEVSAAMWKLLKSDEEELEARRKEAHARRHAEDKANGTPKHLPTILHHGHSKEDVQSAPSA